jgi:hypothetical protein
MPYAELEDALNNPVCQPARRTFGKVEYVFIPVSVVEAVLADAATPTDDLDLDETDYDDEDTAYDPVGEGGITEFPDNEADGEVATEPEDEADVAQDYYDDAAGDVEVAGPSPTTDDEEE